MIMTSIISEESLTRDTNRHRQTARQTGKLGRQTSRQAGRQTDRQTDRHGLVYINMCVRHAPKYVRMLKIP